MADIVSLIAGFNPAGFYNENRALDLQNDAQNMQNSRERKIMSLQDQLASNVQDPWGQYRIYNPQGARQTYLADQEQLEIGSRFARNFKNIDPRNREKAYLQFLKYAPKIGVDVSDLPVYYDAAQIDPFMEQMASLGLSSREQAALEAEDKRIESQREWDMQKLNLINQLENQRADRAFDRDLQLAARSPGEYEKTLLKEQAKADVENQKGLQAVEKMRPSVEASLARAEKSLNSGTGIGPIGGWLANWGINPGRNAGANYANIESANAQMNALLRQRLQATGLTGSELNSAVEANAYRYTISPTDSESVIRQKINNFRNDYLRENGSDDIGDMQYTPIPRNGLTENKSPRTKMSGTLDNGVKWRRV